jgi:hypothetical protein
MFFKWKYFFLGSFLTAFMFGVYVGYLNALIDLDAVFRVERANADANEEYLSFQAERLESILLAKKRALLRRRDSLIADSGLNGDESSPDIASIVTVDYGNLEVYEVEERILSLPVVVDDAAREDLVDELNDLRAFQRQYETVVALRQRKQQVESSEPLVSVGDVVVDSPGSRSTIDAYGEPIVSDGALVVQEPVESFTTRLRRIVDKRNQLSLEVQNAADNRSFWEVRGFSDLGGVQIIVEDRSGGSISLTPEHSSLLSGALSVMPSGFDERIDTIYVIYNDAVMRRGMAGEKVMFLKAEALDFRVVVHELGHVYDLFREVSVGSDSGFKDGSYRIPSEDPSVSFYLYSWANESTSFFSSDSFISGYAASDPFEDFAESFAAFVLQGRYMRDRGDVVPVVSQKYNHLLQVFDLLAFNTGQTYLSQPYDVTLLPVDFEEVFH